MKETNPIKRTRGLSIFGDVDEIYNFGKAARNDTPRNVLWEGTGMSENGREIFPKAPDARRAIPPRRDIFHEAIVPSYV
jgi:hypothetical protein